MRIFTGAPLPANADTVVMQEKTNVNNGMLTILDANISRGANVRLPGSEIREGALALRANSVLKPGAIGFLAGLGNDQVKIYPEPTISIIITGNELQKPGTSPVFGKVYESNSFALMAALKTLNIDSVQLFESTDDLVELTKCLQKALQHSNLVLLTGGVSVGDYDLVVKAAEQCGVDKIFHGVLQRPGKPLYAGKKGDTWVFGLPGNPSSVLTCFYEYVLEAISIMTMHTRSLVKVQASLSHDHHKANRLTQFLKSYYAGNSVEILEAQESYKMRSFALANCLVVLEPDMEHLRKGELVDIHLLPV
jgi:molybdopterin molybdotransferase